MTCLNKGGSRGLYLEPGHGVRKLGNQQSGRWGGPVDSVGRAGEACDRAASLLDLYAHQGIV